MICWINFITNIVLLVLFCARLCSTETTPVPSKSIVVIDKFSCPEDKSKPYQACDSLPDCVECLKDADEVCRKHVSLFMTPEMDCEKCIQWARVFVCQEDPSLVPPLLIDSKSLPDQTKDKPSAAQAIEVGVGENSAIPSKYAASSQTGGSDTDAEKFPKQKTPSEEPDSRLTGSKVEANKLISNKDLNNDSNNPPESNKIATSDLKNIDHEEPIRFKEESSSLHSVSEMDTTDHIGKSPKEDPSSADNNMKQPAINTKTYSVETGTPDTDKDKMDPPKVALSTNKDKSVSNDLEPLIKTPTVSSVDTNTKSYKRVSSSSNTEISPPTNESAKLNQSYSNEKSTEIQKPLDNHLETSKEKLAPVDIKANDDQASLTSEQSKQSVEKEPAITGLTIDSGKSNNATRIP